MCFVDPLQVERGGLLQLALYDPCDEPLRVLHSHGPYLATPRRLRYLARVIHCFNRLAEQQGVTLNLGVFVWEPGSEQHTGATALEI